MRQGGLVPKSHKSGVYWTRANGGKNKKPEDTESMLTTVTIFLLIAPLVLLVFLFIWPFMLLFSKDSDKG
jgi:hypothetical protein